MGEPGLPGSRRGGEGSPGSALEGGGVGGPGNSKEVGVAARVGVTPEARFRSDRTLIGDISLIPASDDYKWRISTKVSLFRKKNHSVSSPTSGLLVGVRLYFLRPLLME